MVIIRRNDGRTYEGTVHDMPVALRHERYDWHALDTSVEPAEFIMLEWR